MKNALETSSFAIGPDDQVTLVSLVDLLLVLAERGYIADEAIEMVDKEQEGEGEPSADNDQPQTGSSQSLKKIHGRGYGCLPATVLGLGEFMGFAKDRDGKIVKLPPINIREDALASAQQMLDSEKKAIESEGGKRKRVETPIVGTDYGYFNIGKPSWYISWYDIGNGVMEKMYHRHRRTALLHANSKFSEKNNTTVSQLKGFYTPTSTAPSHRAWWFTLEGVQKTRSGFKD